MLSFGSSYFIEFYCTEVFSKFFCFRLLAARFLLLRLLTAGDMAARGGSFGTALAAEGPTLFFGRKF